MAHFANAVVSFQDINSNCGSPISNDRLYSNKIISKQLRQKVNEFLSSRKYANNLIEIIQYFETGLHITTSLLTLELLFMELLKRRDMYEEIVPLKPIESSDPEYQYRSWLRTAYDQVWNKVLLHLEEPKATHQIQALSTAMKLIAWEGKYPIEPTDPYSYYFPVNKLRCVLMKILSCDVDMRVLLNKFQEYAVYSDVLFYTWKLLPPLTPKSQPNETYIFNFLGLIDKIPYNKTDSQISMCSLDGGVSLTFDHSIIKKAINKVWSCVMHWEFTPATHRQLLVVLLERILPHLDKPLLLTDFLMDSLDVGGAVSLLALQGIFVMIQSHNLDYPNIFGKLYSMFEPEIFHTKFKARLFYLSDMFLSSTHLSETLVAAFAKRLARLTLIAPSEDILIICLFIGNLILRHPGLKRLINYSSNTDMSTDPFIMEERDPCKSHAIESSLWEIKALQSHILPSIANAARFISQPLPSVEWDLTKVLDNTSDDIFEKEVKKRAKDFILAFDRIENMALPKLEKLIQYWRLT